MAPKIFTHHDEDPAVGVYAVNFGLELERVDVFILTQRIEFDRRLHSRTIRNLNISFGGKDTCHDDGMEVMYKKSELTRRR